MEQPQISNQNIHVLKFFRMGLYIIIYFFYIFMELQLRDWDYRGHLTLYGNNEPWLDTRIVELHKYAREQLPNASDWHK